jgi:hypothetical protein
MLFPARGCTIINGKPPSFDALFQFAQDSYPLSGKKY